MNQVLSGNAAKVVGAIGTILAAASPLIPAVGGVSLSVPAAIVGFILAALAGLSVKPPAVTEGKPVLQGGALAVATGIMTLLVQLWPSVPHGVAQNAVLAVAAILAWLTGKALPRLGSPSAEVLEAAKSAGERASGEVSSKQDAVKELEK